MTDAPRLSKLGIAAVAYARLGWRVFPCFPKSKKPMGLCNSTIGDGTFCDARLPRKDKETGATTCKACGTIHEEPGGLYAATTDVETVTRWWTKEPKANIGIRCGDGLMFLDVDVPNPDEGKLDDGEVSLAKLIEENGPLPLTPNQQTGSLKQIDGSFRRGRQYAFSVDGEYKNSASKLGAGLDTRGDGGYVVAHPSIHPSGTQYEWDADARPSKVKLAPAPAWLLALLTAPKKLSEVASVRQPPADRPTVEASGSYVKAILDGEYDRAANAPKGTRNSNLNTAAFKLGQYVGGGVIDERSARATLQAAAEKSGWAAEEGADAVEKVITSGLDAGVKNPRTQPERVSDRGPHQPPQAKAQLRVVADNTAPEPKPKKRTKKEDEETSKPVPRTGWMIEDWEDHCEFKPDSRILAPKCVRNAIAILLHRAEFADLFVLNKRSHTVIVTRKPPWTANGHPYPRNLMDVDITGFQSAAENLGLRLNRSAYADSINFAARERDYDPVLKSLYSFVWDGVERLDNWLCDYLGADDNTFNRTVGAKWMIAAVERIVKPGSKFDHMLVLEGPQGIMKSTALRTLAEALAPDVFSDRLSPLKNKDSMIELMGKVIVEVAELAAFRGVDAESIKRFLSAQDDDLRLPWDKTTTRLLRGCVFAGTLNPNGQGWLDDPTGGRRFWPVTVKQLDLEKLRAEASQLWAEARVRFEVGERTWIDDDVVLELAAEQVSLRMIDDVWADKIDAILVGRDQIRLSDILIDLGVSVERLDNAQERRVASYILKLGWRRRWAKINGKTARVWIPPVPATLFGAADRQDEEANG